MYGIGRLCALSLETIVHLRLKDSSETREMGSLQQLSLMRLAITSCIASTGPRESAAPIMTWQSYRITRSSLQSSLESALFTFLKGTSLLEHLDNDHFTCWRMESISTGQFVSRQEGVLHLQRNNTWQKDTSQLEKMLSACSGAFKVDSRYFDMSFMSGSMSL